jgi:hypothetical protein
MKLTFSLNIYKESRTKKTPEFSGVRGGGGKKKKNSGVIYNRN